MATMKEQQEQEFRSELDDKLHVATCHIPRGIGRGEKVRHAAQALGFMYDLGRKHACELPEGEPNDWAEQEAREILSHTDERGKPTWPGTKRIAAKLRGVQQRTAERYKAALESEARLHAQHYARAEGAEAEVARLSRELSRFLLGTDRLEILRERDDARNHLKEEHGRVLLETARADDAEKQLVEVREDCLDARGRLEEALQENKREVARTKEAEAKWRDAETHNDELLLHIAAEESRDIGNDPPWRNRHWPVLNDETAKAVDAILAEQGALPPETCPDCHREKATMHDDREKHCARGLSPGLTENALICYRIAYHREKARLDESINNNRILIAAKERAEARVDEAEAREATLAAANKALADDVTRCAGIESRRDKALVYLRLARRWLHFLVDHVGNPHPLALIKRINRFLPEDKP